MVHRDTITVGMAMDMVIAMAIGAIERRIWSAQAF